MSKVLATAKKSARELIACTVACLFLFQALVSGAQIAHDSVAADGAQTSVLVASAFCDAGADTRDDGRAPAQHHRQHCALCGVANRDALLHAVALVATIAVLAVPRSDAAPVSFAHGELSPPPLGWTSSWSSRAPPSIS